MKDFDKYYSKILSQIINRLKKENIQMVIVGGTVRDFLMGKKFGRDIDTELVFPSSINSPDEGFELVKDILTSLNIKMEIQPFYIIRAYLGDNEIEFSIGRREEFIDGDYSHKNFIPHFILGDDFNSKWVRRDVTINAIGYNLMTGEVIDPFNGLNDLKLKKLELISDEFYRDPVRLLRLLRFKLLFNFDISKSINLGKFNLAKLTNYYFFKEGEKVGLSKFFIALNKLAVSFNENHQVYLDFSRVTHFSNFREMVFLSAKFKNTMVWDTLKNDGLFSQKKYRILGNYFDANSKEEKREKLELIKNIGEDFYNWAKDDY